MADMPQSRDGIAWPSDNETPLAKQGPAARNPVLEALILAQIALRRWTNLYAHLQNECGEVVSRKLDYNLPPAGHVKALESIAAALEEVKSIAPRSEPEAQIKPQPAPGAYLLESTALNADYWLKNGRELPGRDEAVLAVEQAINAWKNAAYGLAQKLHFAGYDPTTGTCAPRSEQRERKALEEIAQYTGEGPPTTPWQDIVRSLTKIAREAL